MAGVNQEGVGKGGGEGFVKPLQPREPVFLYFLSARSDFYKNSWTFVRVTEL